MIPPWHNGREEKMKVPAITTERLTLRGFQESDAGPLHRLMDDPAVMRYFPNTSPPTREQVERMVVRQIRHWEEHGYGWWAVELPETGELIGWNGLQYLPETDETEIGYLLGKAHWGKGLATEGGLAGMTFAFWTLGLARIVGIVHPENSASQRVLEKLGLSLTGPAHYFGMDCLHYAAERGAG
jgi:RimJ/RimL family protein N-acetyltransferase